LNRATENKTSLYALLGVIVLFIVGRLWGGQLFENHWSFNHWQFMSNSYPIIWGLVFICLAILFWKFSDLLGKVFSNWIGATVGLAILLGLLILFRFDSFVFGEGNLRIAQVAQTDLIIARWFEYGTIILMTWLYDIAGGFVDKDIDAGLLAWRILAYLGVAFCLIGAAKLAKELVVEPSRRLLLFLIIFCGAQTLTYFGLVGVETLVSPIVIWFGLYAWRVGGLKSQKALLLLWVITVLGVLLQFSLVMLIPAAIYLTVIALLKGGKSRLIAMVSALVSWAILLGLVYQWASGSLEFTTHLLFLSGKRPLTDYSIFSLHHIGDAIQILFMVAPLLIAVKLTALRAFRESKIKDILWAVWLMSMGGFTVLMILDPKQGMVMDLPRLIVYLSPYSIFMAILARETIETVYRPRLWLGLLAAASVMLPLSYVPVYSSIEQSEEYVVDYLKNNDHYYDEACLSYRDNYFQTKEFDSADRWEWKLPAVSLEYLNLQGNSNLLAAGRFDEAITELNNMIARNPYNVGPRARLAAAQMQLGRYDMARPQIDTCLMLEPYNRRHHIHLYSFYRNTGKTADALRTVLNALDLFPGDFEIRTDQMLLNFRGGNVKTADSLAHSLNESDPDLPYPYLVLGMIEEVRKNHRGAIPHFEKFIELAPEVPETPMIQNRLDSLRVQFPQ
jgi:tetratricopeptide (TPR) repeat protein